MSRAQRRGLAIKRWLIVVFLLLAGHPALAQIAYRNSADLGDNNGSGTISVAYTVNAASNLLVVGVAGDVQFGADDVQVPTFNGVAMTLIAKETGSGCNTDRILYLYYLLAPATGAHTLTITSTANHYLLAGAADYSGVKQSGQPDASVSSCDTTIENNYISSITTVADNSWPIMFGGSGGTGGSPACSAGATLRTSGAHFGDWLICDSSAIHPAGSHSMTATLGDNTGTTAQSRIIASFAPTVAGGGSMTLHGGPF
jgi:hypothetical protein